MTAPVFISMPRAEVVSYLSLAWPPQPGDPCLVVPPDAALTDGAAIVYPQEGRPGTCWWVVDSTIPRQDAGIPDEVLAGLLPGSVLGTVLSPLPTPDTPPES
ncbi:hypothetical protein ACFWNK_01790 [Streptomyces sp. NPDC058417]|uniref:hypothetical protein n=1 Tax=unclassified Streptomyces TaxID=2593676 RepID=UPI003662B0D0